MTEKTAYYHVQQPNDWSCLAAVAAMAVGDDSIDRFVKFIGHDGSEKIPKSLHPEGHRGFRMVEAVRYLAEHDLGMGCYLNADFTVPDNVFGLERPAIVAVQSTRYPKCLHMVLWVNPAVLDPRKEEPTALDKYEIKEWWPLIDLGPDQGDNE